MMLNMGDVIDLRERRVYSFRQIDDILKLHSGTSARWIDGYQRGGKFYEPVVREEHSGDSVATWGEFVECRLLSEYRTAGVSLHRMRPAVQRLRREVTDSRYPLASAQLWLMASGRELVARAQDDVDLDRALLVVVRTGQGMLDWSPRARSFSESVTWSSSDADAQPLMITPDPQVPSVVVDPRRGYGDPVLVGRNVSTAVLRELFDAGESLRQIASEYDLSPELVEDAVRFERRRLQHERSA